MKTSVFTLKRIWKMSSLNARHGLKWTKYAAISLGSSVEIPESVV